MRTILIEPTLEAWRARAKSLLAERAHHTEVLWSDDAAEASLFSDATPPPSPAPSMVQVPAIFIDIARRAAAHRDPRRWGVLYRVLWRLTLGQERTLLGTPTDPDLHLLQKWDQAVRRDIHKMRAFVRFRLTGTHALTGREQFVSWFEPEHRIVRLNAGFFQKRFTGMDWSILTPDECAHWDGETLHFTPGLPRSAAPADDELETLWLTYYKSIFNPARLKVKAMQSEMPKKYWKNLPEAELIAALIQGSGGRVQDMLETPLRPAKPAPKNNYLENLQRLNKQDEQPPP